MKRNRVLTVLLSLLLALISIGIFRAYKHFSSAMRSSTQTENVTEELTDSSQALKLDPQTGLIKAPGFKTVREHCTPCHSAKLVIQNRMDRAGWLEYIRWMQEEGDLQPLSQKTEERILKYLSTYYSPQSSQ